MAEEERETIWLVVVDGEGSGETRICLGDEKLIEVVNELCEGDDWRTRRDIYNWREYLEDEDNWTTVSGWRYGVLGEHARERWRLTTDIGETGRLLIQRIDKQDMMELV